MKVGVLDRGRVRKDVWLWWNVWGDAVLSVRSLGRAKREGSKNRGTSGGMPGP